MGENGCRADFEHSTNIPYARAIHGHIDDTLMSTWLVTIVSILKMEALVAVAAQTPLMPSIRFAIFDDTTSPLTLDTCNLNNSHRTLRTKIQEYIRSTALIHDLLIQHRAKQH